MTLMSGKFIGSWTAGSIAVTRGQDYCTSLSGRVSNNTPDATSWNHLGHLKNAHDLVQAFHQAYPDKPAP